MMVLVPSDAALRSYAASYSSVGDPLSSDVSLQRDILAAHIITSEGSIPEKTFSSLPPSMEVEKVDLGGNKLVFTKDSKRMYCTFQNNCKRKSLFCTCSFLFVQSCSTSTRWRWAPPFTLAALPSSRCLTIKFCFPRSVR